MNKVEEIKNEQDVQINTSISLLQEIQNPYPEPVVPQKEVEEEKKELSEGLEDLAEQSLISDSSHNTEFDTEQLQPIQGVKYVNQRNSNFARNLLANRQTCY